MHILGILAFLMALIVAAEVIRQTLVTNGDRILEALAGQLPETIDIHTEIAARVLPFKPVVVRHTRFQEPMREAA